MPDNSSSWSVKDSLYNRNTISIEELQMAYYNVVGIKAPPDVIEAYKNRLILNEIHNIWEEVPEWK